MGDRFDGALAAGASSGIVTGDLSIPAALQSLHLHETLITGEDSETDTHNEQPDTLLALRAVQNPEHGGVMYTSERAHWGSSSLLDAIRQSQMTSMLLDDSRCSKYATAIRTAISVRKQKHAGTAAVNVLDIGAGTGLLAGIAAKAGATHVDAVEMFQPLARLARDVIEYNQLNHIVTVHAIHSSQLSLPHRADIIVTETFDSALLGEGCLPSIRHARKQHLANKECTVIPARATVRATIVHSPFLARFHCLGEHFPLHRADNGASCLGGVVPVPVHLRALDDCTYMTDTFDVFDMDLSAHDVGEEEEEEEEEVKVFTLPFIKGTAHLQPHAVITWWVLDLLGDGSITYSTAPDTTDDWQDHWLQVAHPLPSTSTFTSSSSTTVTLSATRDALRMHFALGKARCADDVRKPCTCGWHAMPAGPYRIHELSDITRLDALAARVRAAVQRARASYPPGRHVRCIDVSDGAVCALLAGRDFNNENEHAVSIVSTDDDEVCSFVQTQIARRLRATNVLSIEFEPVATVAQRVRESLVQHNNNASEEEDSERFDVVLAEPYTRCMSRFPLSVLGNLIVLRRVLNDVVRKQGVVESVPERAQIMAQLVTFTQPVVQKMLGTVGTVQGIDHSVYDKLCERGQDVFGSHEDEDDDDCEKELRRRLSLPLFQYDTVDGSERRCIQTVALNEIVETQLEEKKFTTIHVRNKHSERSVEAVALCVVYDECTESSVQRYEMIVLDEMEREAVRKSGVVVVSSRWDAATSTWDLDIDLKRT